MLSSRYLHLHEALGLGPMWLKHSAKSLPATVSTPAVAASSPAATATTPAPTTPNNAHAAAMQAIGKLTHSTEHRHESTTTVPPPDSSKQTKPATITASVSTAKLMIISICASPEDQVAGKLFSGSVGTLLDNMLAAISLTPAEAHRSCWIQTSAQFTPEPDVHEIAAALPALQAELCATQAHAVLFLGQVFEQPDYQTPIRQLCGDTPFFTTPHPARLLRQPKLKAQAWAILKQIKNTVR